MLISLNIWVAKFKTSILRFCTYSDENSLKKTMQVIANKTEITRFLFGCLFGYTFCQFLLVDFYLRLQTSLTHANVQCFVNIVIACEANIVMIAEVIFIRQVAGPSVN